jgi:predicted SprT family Zn-dependent metalloprotease
MNGAALQSRWAALNARYFHGVLPPIRIEWSRRLTSSAGLFTSAVGPRHPVLRHPTGATARVIRLSRPLLADQAEHEIVGTLAHEMIHQWQYDVLKRRPNHGPDFRRKMAAMNRDGIGVTIHHDLTDAVRAFTRFAWTCTRCGRVYERQRRTIRPRVHRCGACRGSLRELSPQPRQLTTYALSDSIRLP